MAKRTKKLIGWTAVLVVGAFCVSLCIGKYPLSIGDIWTILTNGPIDELKRSVFFMLRLPRVVMGLLAGLGLGLSGAVYQTIFKNPLASPEIIGVSSGANLGAAAAIVLIGYHVAAISMASFVCALAVVFLVIALVRVTRNSSTATYVLAGIVLKAVAEALIMLLKYFADPEQQLAAIEFWSMGSLGAVTLEKVLTILPIFLVGLIGIILLRRHIPLLGLHEDEARALGLRLRPIRFAVLACTTLLVASIICVTGRIAFVGLIGPHIARLATKRNDFATCIFAALVGALILLVADGMARSLYTSELPISVLTTLLGAPVLVYYLRSRKQRRAA